MKTKFTNDLIDLLYSKTSLPVFKMWGGQEPISMGDGIRFRVTNSPKVDYVYIRYLSGFDEYEVEFGALVGTDYDVLDRIKPISRDQLVPTISRKIFFDEG